MQDPLDFRCGVGSNVIVTFHNSGWAKMKLQPTIATVFVGISFFFKETAGQQGITGLTLIDAQSNIASSLGEIRDGDVIDLSTVGNQLSIRADTIGPVAKVLFFINDRLVRSEKTAEYALGGNSGSTYTPVPELLLLGTTVIRAEAYLNKEGSILLNSYSAALYIITTVPESLAPTESPATILPESLHPDIIKIVEIEGENPGGLSWADSYCKFSILLN